MNGYYKISCEEISGFIILFYKFFKTYFGMFYTQSASVFFIFLEVDLSIIVLNLFLRLKLDLNTRKPIVFAILKIVYPKFRFCFIRFLKLVLKISFWWIKLVFRNKILFGNSNIKNNFPGLFPVKIFCNYRQHKSSQLILHISNWY